MKINKNLNLVLAGIIIFILGAFVNHELEPLSIRDVFTSQKLMAIDFTASEADSMLDLLAEHRKNYQNMRLVQLSNDIPPAFVFDPLLPGMKPDQVQKPLILSDYSSSRLPDNINDLSYYSIGQLAELIKTKKISSVKLTQFFMDRLKKYSGKLNCVITFTDSLAMQQARQADAEIAAGKYRGILHGIPYGIKDMFATKNYVTTFGTSPFRNQYIAKDAAVVTKLKEAGAVLLAKLSLGELAMDDIWFGGMTRNPWDTSKGSSGSSAGPASAVSAGLLPFAIGSETWGSIVSPSTICGVSGLRPSFGRVSRDGAMALSWTMDKIGPLCRNAEDCAIVCHAISGKDEYDRAGIRGAFNYSYKIDFKKLKIGYFAADFDKDSSVNKPFNEATLSMIKQMGAELIPLKLPDLPVNDMSLLLECEAAAAFDDLTLDNRDDEMAQQNKNRWPNYFRAAHFIPATEYIRAQRLRTLLMRQMNEVMSQVDLCIAPSLAGDNLLITNLTGHPALVIPNGFVDASTPTSIVCIGRLFEEGKLIAAGKMIQDRTGFHLKHPPGFE